MTPLGLILTLIFGLVVFSQPRVVAAVAIIAAVCYLTEGQVLNIAGFHFTAIRFVLLAGLIRVTARGESRQLRFNPIDRSLVAYAFGLLIISTVRVGTLEQLVYELGGLYNILVGYFVFRCLLRDERDYCEFFAKAAFVIIPFAAFILFETCTHRNVFAVFGGVEQISMVRDGHVRSEGPFRSPITAGAFGATFALLFASLVFAKLHTRTAVVGLIVSMVIMICAHSSGPFLGLALGFLALACWPWRRQTRTIRWAIVIGLVGLQLVMNAPVWFTLARVSDIFGGGGYHRAYLIQQFITRFSSWWLVGTSDTHDWFPYQLYNGEADITNRFVADGISGGLVGLILSVTVIVRCFQRLGAAMKTVRGIKTSSEKVIWGIGSTLVGSIGILFSVTYFDQMQYIWYFLLACIASVDIQKCGSGQTASYRNDREKNAREILIGRRLGHEI